MFVFVQPTTNYLYVTCCYIEYNKMKNKLYHTVGTVPKSNRKIIERGKMNTPYKHVHCKQVRNTLHLHTLYVQVRINQLDAEDEISKSLVHSCKDILIIRMCTSIRRV